MIVLHVVLVTKVTTTAIDIIDANNKIELLQGIRIPRSLQLMLIIP
jgi:hypothetical protein